ncbi:MAG: ABC transporter permease subunit [Oscillospiraceae bacterium]|nr:ABC transporter permease subunit [Oscillospiraceae bacterium]
MNSFNLFFRKEIVELVKTVKGVVLTIVFLFLAISAPLITKLTPEILKAAGGSASQDEMNVLTSIIPTPTSVESYKQFVSNFSTIGLLAIIIVFAGIVANEKAKNTAAYILTKNISRTQFIFSKFASAVVFILVSLIISAGVLKLYTDLLFDDNLVDFKYFIIFFAFLFLYIFFILTIVLFSSIISKNVTSATFIAFLIFIAFSILPSIPKIGKYTPAKLNDLGIMLQSTKVSDLTINIIVTVLCSVAFILIGIKLFNRQEL